MEFEWKKIFLFIVYEIWEMLEINHEKGQVSELLWVTILYG